MKTKAYQIQPARCKKSYPYNENVLVNEFSTDFKNWFESKEDGIRYLLQIRPNGARINYLTSRVISKKTANFVEKQDVVTFIRDYPFLKGLWDTVLDGELVGGELSSDTAHEMTVGNVKYIAWDVLRYKGEDVTQRTLRQRQLLLTQIIAQVNQPWLKRVFGTFNARWAIEHVTANKKEGLVLKKLCAPYGEDWIKFKKLETHDVVILGYQESKSEDWKKKGWIGALVFGQWERLKCHPFPIDLFFNDLSSHKYVYTAFDQRGSIEGIMAMEIQTDPNSLQLTKYGTCSGMSEKEREEFSSNKRHYIGKVIEIECQQRLKSGAFRHPRYVRLRHDKSFTECIYEE